jgi:anti-sigma regulatory factor (Ser/Thr protein kinase)/cbb3-type cytochrome oxidase subunit 3
MFNQLKTKLTFLYTFSLLFLLLCFIGVLYFLISHQINQNENEEVKSLYEKEKMHIIEDYYEKEHHGLSYDPNRETFFYTFDKKNHFVYGIESIQNLSGWVEKENLKSPSKSYTKKVAWKDYHLILMKKPLSTNGYTHGYIIIGKDISSEHDLIEKITWGLLFLTIFFSLLYGFMGYTFAGQALKPIKTAFHKKEKFVSDASHELRTPLSIFYSSIDLLNREENLSAFGKEVLQDVKAEAELMNKLINELLFLARSDKNTLTMEKKQVNLSDLLLALYTRFVRKISGNVKFEHDIESNLHYICDETRIQQLLYILLDNAFRYTKEGKVELALKQKAGKIIITVSDTGCGIAINDLPHIFDRFYRGDLSREKGGSGLGLSIAKTIVAAHSGKIYAASELGKGSVFTVVFETPK